MTTLPPPIASTPSSPARIERQIGALVITLDAAGLVISDLSQLGAEPITLTIDSTLALFDFARTAGARQLVNRAWLAAQHAAALDAGQSTPRTFTHEEARTMGPTIDCTVTIGAASWDMPMEHTPDTPVDDTMDVAGDTVATYLGVDGTPVTVGATFTAAEVWRGDVLHNVIIV